MEERHIITTAGELEKIIPRLIEALPKKGDQENLESLNTPETAAVESKLSDAFALLKQETPPSGVMFSPQNKYVSLLQSMIAENPTSLSPSLDGETLEAKFDRTDWGGWLGTFLHILENSGKFAWKEPPAAPEVVRQFGKAARLAVFGDWGTGLYGAPVIAKSIAADQEKIDVIMHLGDVYYSGTQKEFSSRFTNLWPARSGALNRALNGNHEMYSGGRSYSSAIQAQPFEQPASYFSCQNEHWILVGLDTAYQEHDLTDDQLLWLNNIVNRSTPLQKIVLFSHHQPFSLLDAQGPRLQAKLKPLLEAGSIFAWYWGHEHACVIYEKHRSWNLFGRCIGHAGMPEVRNAQLGPAIRKRSLRAFAGSDRAPAALVLDGPNEYIKGEENKFMPHGYLILEFDGPSLVEHYHDPDGCEFHSIKLE